jgi:hypothetical protein
MNFNSRLSLTSIWNSLPGEVVSALAISSFKNALDKFESHQEVITRNATSLELATEVKFDHEDADKEAMSMSIY